MLDPAIRYLLAKRSVDDRSLNRHVIDTLRAHVSPGTEQTPVRVLEIGAGPGTMIARSLDWKLLEHADYTVLDSDRAALAELRRSVPEWARERGARVDPDGPDTLGIFGRWGRIDVHPVRADLLDFRGEGGPWDLVIANAVLDLVDVPTTLPRIWSFLRPGGYYWFTINFDGETLFLPQKDPDLDEHIAALYHRTMDERVIRGRPSGDSRTGRHLFQHLADSGASVLAAGASDWVVHPIAGAYPNDEDVFLHHIIDTVESALARHPELDDAAFQAWVAARHRQIENAHLTYIAHQLDFFGRPGKDLRRAFLDHPAGTRPWMVGVKGRARELGGEGESARQRRQSSGRGASGVAG